MLRDKPVVNTDWVDLNVDCKTSKLFGIAQSKQVQPKTPTIP